MADVEALKARLRQLRSSCLALEKRQEHSTQRLAAEKAMAEAKWAELQRLRAVVANRHRVEREAREDIAKVLPEAKDVPYERLPELVLWARRALELRKVVERLQKQRRSLKGRLDRLEGWRWR